MDNIEPDDCWLNYYVRNKLNNFTGICTADLLPMPGHDGGVFAVFYAYGDGSSWHCYEQKDKENFIKEEEIPAAERIDGVHYTKRI